MIGARRSPATVEAPEGTGIPSARRDPVLPVPSSGDETVPILLVDDQPANLDALEASLATSGCRFVLARPPRTRLLSASYR